MGKHIAIISACHNVNPELLTRHFLSVQTQGHINEDILHIVVDDCSTNLDTRASLLYHADANKENTLLVARKENGGPGKARNRALEIIEKSHSKRPIDYVCLLDADDYFENDSLQLRRNVLDEDNYIAVYGNKYNAKYGMAKDIIDGQMVFTELNKTLENVPDYDKARLFRECYVPSCSVMFRYKPFAAHVKSFREDVRLCEDWLIWRKLALLGEFKKINMPIYTQTLHGGNLTMNEGVLKNHFRDMVTTKMDLEQWIDNNRLYIKL